MTKLFKIFPFLFFSSIVFAHDSHEHTPEAKPAYHLAFRNNTVHLHIDFENTPAVGSESFLKIQARNGEDHSILNLTDTVDVELSMADMGHGSAPTQVERSLDAQGNSVPGLFRVRNVYFVMGGDWDVRETLTDKNGVAETRSFSINFAETHNH